MQCGGIWLACSQGPPGLTGTVFWLCSKRALQGLSKAQGAVRHLSKHLKGVWWYQPLGITSEICSDLTAPFHNASLVNLVTNKQPADAPLLHHFILSCHSYAGGYSGENKPKNDAMFCGVKSWCSYEYVQSYQIFFPLTTVLIKTNMLQWNNWRTNYHKMVQ